jgi:predicted metal-dependent phosphotriesterase family hydrolase
MTPTTNGQLTGLIQTVTGPVPAERVGRILHHEHLLSLTPGPWLTGGQTSLAAGQVAAAVSALRGLRSRGFNTVVDLSPYGVVGRDADGGNVALLKEISENSQVYIIAGTAVYLESFSPQWAKKASLDQLTARFIADATDGIGNTAIKAGILGEQATSFNAVTSHEEKCLRAAARAAKSTGLALITHTTHGTMAARQIEILQEEEIDLTRVVIGHQDTRAGFDGLLQILGTGVNIAFDTIGKQAWDFFLAPPETPSQDGEYTKRAYRRSDVTRMTWLLRALEHGYLSQILLSQDLTGAEVYLNPDTHGQWGLTYLAAAFPAIEPEPATRGRRITDEQLHTMLRDNPLRLLTVPTRAAHPDVATNPHQPAR